MRSVGRPLPYRRERIATPDGDFLDLDHYPPDGDPADHPTVVVLHGLEGCSRSGYVETTCRELGARGLHAVALNFRGCSGEPNRTPRFYHSGETGDLDLVLQHLASQGAPRLGAIGFSLGGNVLLKYLGENGTGHAVPEAAAAVSVPFDLAASADHLDRGVGRLYSSHFLRSLHRKVREKARRFPEAYDVRAATSTSTLRQFDDAVTAPVHGFRDAADYYRRSSCGPHIPRIRVPTLVLQARDDPFVPLSSIPDSASLDGGGNGDGAELHLTRHGGHVGFLGMNRGRPHTWAEARATRFLARRLG